MRDRASLCDVDTGGGIRAPFVDATSSGPIALRKEERLDEAVSGRFAAEVCRGRDASSFTGGVGATGSSGASIPRGPNGSIESSSVSSVVDCARLPCLLGPRVLEGASLTCVLDAGDMGSGVGFDEACSVILLLVTLSNIVSRWKHIPAGFVFSPSADLDKLWLEFDREGTSGDNRSQSGPVMHNL